MDHPTSLTAAEVAIRARPSVYPPPFATRMLGRTKRVLGDLFGLRNFGVNLTDLQPGASSALHHAHSRQDEFVFVLEGEAVLVTGEGRETVLRPGDCAGFPAGGAPHHLENRSSGLVRYLEVGDRTEGDEASYPEDDLVALRAGGGWRFCHKDGKPY
jgi:uncharacterized cupin superfamily protein